MANMERVAMDTETAREWLKKRTRPMTREEAMVSARRLTNSHFRNKDHAKMSIPAHPDDDDLFLMDYLRLAEPPPRAS